MEDGPVSYLERRAVGRKTPLDGKLEISPATAERLRPLGAPLGILVSGAPARQPTRRGLASLTTMACTCAKGAADGSHEHHFLESDLFRGLPIHASLALDLGPDGVVLVTIGDAA